MLTYNVKVKFSSEEHRLYWCSLMETSKEAYNDIAKLIFESKCSLGLKQVHALVYDKMREKYPELPAQAIIKIYKDVISNLRACKRKHCPVRKEACLHLDKNLTSGLCSRGLKLTSHIRNKRLFVEFVTYSKFDELASRYQMKYPLIFMRDNEVWMSVPFDVPSKPVADETYLGVDLGIRRIYTTSDGLSFKGSKINALKRKIRY